MVGQGKQEQAFPPTRILFVEDLPCSPCPPHLEALWICPPQPGTCRVQPGTPQDHVEGSLFCLKSSAKDTTKHYSTMSGNETLRVTGLYIYVVRWLNRQSLGVSPGAKALVQ